MLAAIIPATVTAHLTYEAVTTLLKSTTNLLLTTNQAIANIPSVISIMTLIEDKDVVCKLRVVQSLILEIKDTRWLRDRSSVKFARESVHEAVIHLQTHLDALNHELVEHQKRYFASWRSPTFAPALDAMAKWSFRLDERLHTLRDVIMVATATNPHKEH
jgi:hypothetical protein